MDDNTFNAIMETIKVSTAALGIIVAILVAVVIFLIICSVTIFKKAGKPGWAAIVPYYSNWVENEIAGCHWIIFVLGILNPALSLFRISLGNLGTILTALSGILIMYNLCKKFNKDTGFFIGTILLPIVFIPILAFSKNIKYDSSVKVKNCVFFDANF